MLTITIKIPALDRLVDYLEEKRQNEAMQQVEALTQRLRDSSQKLSDSQIKEGETTNVR